MIAHDPDAELDELKRYLGDAFDLQRLYGHEQAVLDEHARTGDESELYRTSDAYLYDLTAFAMTETKLPYLRDLTSLVPPGSHLLDYGCGIGSDGLRLIDAGYRVSFADFDNPSTAYLTWRLEQRGVGADVFDLDAGPVPGGFDAAYSFDVIEHVEDPVAFLEILERSARLVCVNFLEEVEDDIAIHHALPIDALVRRAASRRLLRYRVYHGRSHLVLYRPDGGFSLRSRAAYLSGRLRARSA